MRFKIETSLTLADNPVRVIDFFIDDLAVNSDWGSMVMPNQLLHPRTWLANPEQVVIDDRERVAAARPFMGITTQYRKEIHPVGRHKEIVKALRDGDDVKLVAAIEADIRDGSGLNNFEISKEPGTRN